MVENCSLVMLFSPKEHRKDLFSVTAVRNDKEIQQSCPLVLCKIWMSFEITSRMWHFNLKVLKTKKAQLLEFFN